MTPAETARALFYFSAHTHDRPAPITTDANHMAVPHAREYQRPKLARSRETARGAAAILLALDHHASKKQQNTTFRPSYLNNGGANALLLLVH